MNDLEKLEALRKDIAVSEERRNKLFWLLSPFMLFAIIMVVLNRGTSRFHSYLMLLLVLLLVTIMIFAIYSIRNAPRYDLYKEMYKKLVVYSTLSKTFTNVRYEPNSGIDRDYLASLDMIDMGDIYESEDYVSGNYKNVAFFLSDINIEEEETKTDSKGNEETYYETLFKGQWMVFDFNKSFKSNIQLAEKVFWGGTDRKLFPEKKYKKIKLESSEFNKKFAIFAENEHEAFYVLTPRMMENILSLADKCEAPLFLCFINNQLHIGLNNYRNFFEPPNVKKPLSSETLHSAIGSEIEQITMFIDDLELDNNLFKREVEK